MVTFENSTNTQKEQEYLKSFLKDVVTLDRYVAYKSQTDFFMDTCSKKTDLIIKALIKFCETCPSLSMDSRSHTNQYQGFPALLASVTPTLNKCGCKILQLTHSLPVGKNQDIRTFIVTIVTHDSEQYFRSVTSLCSKTGGAKATEIDSDPKAFGCASTYAKRYALKSILGIDADKDTDGN